MDFAEQMTLILREGLGLFLLECLDLHVSSYIQSSDHQAGRMCGHSRKLDQQITNHQE